MVRGEAYNLSHETRTPGRQERTMHRGLTGLRVVSFESRRSAEVAELIRNHGGAPIQAPSIARQATALLERKRRG